MLLLCQLKRNINDFNILLYQRFSCILHSAYIIMQYNTPGYVVITYKLD